MNLPRLLFLPVLCLLIAARVHSAGLTLHSDFPGGSAEVHALDADAGLIEISPVSREGRGWPCWWYFRVDGARPGQALTVRVKPAGRPFRAQERLAAAWSLPARAAISSDDQTWRHTEPGTVTKTDATYAITAPAATFWLAWGPPFLPAHSEALLEQTASRVPGAERFVLAKTREGREVPGMRLGKKDAPQAVWVHARQHAWEAGGSWVGRGFLEWVAGDTPEAAALRASTEIFFIPIMDVDNVALGAGGKEAVPRDHNRDWDTRPVYPEVAAAQQRVEALIQVGRLRCYFDLHNPGSGDKQPFFFGPMDYEQMTGPRRASYDRFLSLCVQHMREPLPILPRYRFATYVKTQEERDRMSGNWVRDRTPARAVAMTLETAWNTPHSTQDGYLHVGQGLAKAMAAWLRE